MAAVLLPSAAWAHASLIASDPAKGVLLAHAPATLTLTFNEPVEPLTIRIVDQSGTGANITRIRRDGAHLILTPPATLGDGAHVISWRVISADGHPVGGSTTFWVGRRDGDAPQVVRSDDMRLRGAIWLARLAIYFGLFVGAGGAFFVAWMRAPSAPVMRVIGSSVELVALAALALSVGLQGLDALALPLSSLPDPDVWAVGARGSFGLSAALAAAALLLALLSHRAGGPRARVMSLGALVGVGLTLATTGHAATASPRWLTAPAVFVHGTALAFWVGSLVPLALAMRGPRQTVIDVLTRFSRVIPFAVAALLASGLLLAVIQLERLDALWTTNYGRVLTFKLVLVALLLAVALWNRLYLTPRIGKGRVNSRRQMRRTIVAELVLVAGILGIVGLWRFTPPPRALMVATEPFFTHLHTGQMMADVTVSPDRAGPISIEIQLRTPDEEVLAAKGVSARLSSPDNGIEPSTAEAQSLGEGQWRVSMAAPVAGQWTLAFDILISDFNQLHAEAEIQIK
ncbi:CopD family protein [Nitrobacter sp. NHB1]|uniref:copper resistance CopC/CopD family protein n=1 Tax=Nitrobacter sp. NHB1 TaxID=3119830 RepID=UPI002FFF295C